MKRYETYKDSGIKSIGDIPNHWRIEPFGRHFTYGKGLPITKANLLPEGIAVISYGQIHSKDNNGTRMTDNLVRFVSPNYLQSNPQSLLEENDFIFADTSEDIEGCGNCAFNDYSDKIFAGYHTVVARPKDLPYPRYYAYLFQSKSWKSQIHSLVNGVKVYSINKWILKKSVLLFPPLAEQEAIVAFLDEKTGEIDGLVSQVEREIELLKEYKQAEIARVVTKGLNPDAPIRPSGISWIGDIPAHWILRKAKYVFKKHKRPVRSEDEVITCFRDGEVTLRKNRRTTGFTESLTETGYQGVRKGDLVIHQMDAFAGAIGISDSDGKGTPVYHCCTPITNENTRYFCYQIRMMAFSGFIQSLYRGIRERSSDFNFQVFGNQYLFMPPLEEQQEIVDYIDRKTTEIDRLVVELTYQVEYLKEYKQRLIADVVTGKINVQPN